MFPKLFYKFKTLFVLVFSILLGTCLCKQDPVDLSVYPFLVLVKVQTPNTEVYYLNGCLASLSWVLTVSKDLAQMTSGRLKDTSVDVFLGPKTNHSLKEFSRSAVLIKTSLLSIDDNKIFPNLVLLRLISKFPSSQNTWPVVFNVGMLKKEAFIIGWAIDAKTNQTLDQPLSLASTVLTKGSCNKDRMLVNYQFQLCTVAVGSEEPWHFLPGALFVDDKVLTGMLQEHMTFSGLSYMVFVRMATYVPWVQYFVLDPIPSQVYVLSKFNSPDDKFLNVLLGPQIKVESSPWLSTSEPTMNPITAKVADETFPKGGGFGMALEDAGGTSGSLVDLAANEKTVNYDVFNDFDDFYYDEDLN